MCEALKFESVEKDIEIIILKREKQKHYCSKVCGRKCFWKMVFYPPKQHLSDKKYSKNSYIVKYYYKL